MPAIARMALLQRAHPFPVSAGLLLRWGAEALPVGADFIRYPAGRPVREPWR